MKKSLLFIASLALLATVSCQSSDSKESGTATDAATSETVSTSPQGDDGQNDVVDVAVGSKDHTTLVSAIKQAELVEPLKKTGPYTVFAPVNAAFDKLPAGTLDELMKPEKKDALADILQYHADILQYHVSVGIYNEDMFQDGQVIGQVNSQNITIGKKDGKITVNGTANVIGSVRASNGIIYVIDQVLLPPKK